MNAELEALAVALNAVVEARSGDEAQRLDAIYLARIDDVLARYTALDRARLMQAVDFAHGQWLRGQRKPTALPPKA
jgi:hypothetical protein